MMRPGRRRRWMFGTVAAAAVLVPAGMAWGCVTVANMIANNPAVQPGGTVSITVREFAQGAPIEIHLDSATGPLLTTVPPPTTTMTSTNTWDVPIPANTPYGTHTLNATQNYHNMQGGLPARATIYVGTQPPASVAPPARPASVDVGEGPSAASLVLIALGVAAALLIIAGVWSLAAGGRRAGPEAQPVKLS